LTYTVAASVQSVVVVSLLVNVVLGRARWMTAGQTAITLAGSAMLALFNVAPTSALAARRLDIFHGMVMLPLAAFVWFSSPEHLLFSLGSAMVFRLGYSCMNLSIAHSVALNLLVDLAGCLRAWYGAQDGTTSGMVYMFEGCATMGVAIAAVAFKYWTVAGLRQEIRFGVLKSEASASMSLLDMLCDVVVELNSDMTIARSSPAMAAFLMLSPGKSIAGMHICDFVPDETERRSFKDRIFASRTWPKASVGPSVGTCRLRFSDSMSSPVNVEIFFVKVDLLNEDCRYMLGIREFSDEVAPMPTFPKAEGRPRRRRESARKGTPHTCELASLEATGPQEAPDPQATPPGGDGLRYPGLLPTMRSAKYKQLVELASCWNTTVPMMACCPFHAYIADVRKIARETGSGLPCIVEFPCSPLQGKQCQKCGVLCCEDEEECAHCESRDLSPVPDTTV